MVKTCSWGTCNSDTRFPERIVNVRFIPFPKPKTNWEKCARWVKACGRPHSQLNTTNIDRHKFVCSKHFVEFDGPSEEFPDPLPADGSRVKKSRPHWRQRHSQSESKTIKQLDFLPQVIINPNAEKTEAVLPRSDHDYVQPQIMPPPRPSYLTNCSPLSVLSVAAEIRDLQQQLHQQKILNEHLSLENVSLKKLSSNRCDYSHLNVQMILKHDTKVKGLFEYYSSLRYPTFVKLLQFLTSEDAPKIQRKRKDIMSMTNEDQLFLTLLRLRHNFGLKDLAFRFGISLQAVSEIFNAWIDHMFLLLGAIPIWPHRDEIIANMPLQYKSEFPSTMAILDCTELKTQKPSSLKLQSQMYSDYKSATTLKALVACDPMGNIIFVSELFTGSMSDKEITVKSGFLKLLGQLLMAGYMKVGDSVMADKGFTISEELGKIGVKLDIPPFVSAGTQLSQANVNLTQKIAQHRIHVERAIKKIRVFKMVSNCIGTNVFGSVNKIWTVCSLLTLWQNPILKSKENVL